HQHGLAAADLAVNIKPAWRAAVLVREQPAEETLLARRAIIRQPRFERAEGLDGVSLRGIGLDRAGTDEILVMRAKRGGLSGQHGALTALRSRKMQAVNSRMGYAAPARTSGK